jgi:hypothetical protein
VRCVKPNPNKKPRQFLWDYTRPQLECGGLIEALRILKLGYPTRVSYVKVRACRSLNVSSRTSATSRPSLLPLSEFCCGMLWCGVVMRGVTCGVAWRGVAWRGVRRAQLYERYGKILKPEPPNLNKRDFSEAILVVCGKGILDASEYQLGLTKVFFRPGKQSFLEDLLHSGQGTAPPSLPFPSLPFPSLLLCFALPVACGLLTCGTCAAAAQS